MVVGFCSIGGEIWENLNEEKCLQRYWKMLSIRYASLRRYTSVVVMTTISHVGEFQFDSYV